jgi:hypothetical protein
MARAEIALSVLKDHIDPKDEKKLLRWIMNSTEKRAGKR